MGFTYAESDEYFNMLLTDPLKFLAILKTTNTIDHLISDVDLVGYEYSGANIFHCLSRIVGNDKPNNFGDTIDCPSSLGCELFDLLRTKGANPYHYIDNCCSPVYMSKMCGNKGNDDYLEYICNFYTNNPPILDDITVSDDCSKIVSDIITKDLKITNCYIQENVNSDDPDLTNSEYNAMVRERTKQYIFDRMWSA